MTPLDTVTVEEGWLLEGFANDPDADDDDDDDGDGDDDVGDGDEEESGGLCVGSSNSSDSCNWPW